MNTAREAALGLGVASTCRALGVPRASYYRFGRPRAVSPRPPRAKPPRALGAAEEQVVLDVLHGERFADQAPPEIYATLLEEGTYLCSVRTMYRILDAHGELRERRDQLRHPHYAKPELLATAPNQVWSWDITKLLGPTKWTYFYLYVLLDIFSRYVVGWMLAHRESRALARRLILETCLKEDIVPGQLTLHADRGAAMTSKPVAHLLADLGVTKTHSRPHVSNDNPFSESQFKTMKYQPEFPERFETYEHGHGSCSEFFPWYNNEHHHAGLAYLTPATVHHGRVAEVLAVRQAALDAAFAAHPERFVHRPPQTPRPPEKVWINPPATPVLRIEVH
jgi:putative transposase